MRNNVEWKGATWKQDEDFTPAANELLARVNADEIPVLLRSTNLKLENYVEELMVLEKRARLGGDFISSKRLAVECIRIHRTSGTIASTCEALELLMRKRGQSKDVQTAMVEEAARILEDSTQSRGGRIAVLEKLRFITDGKIHVEVQFARFTKSLADMCVEDNRLREASDMLGSVHIETITSIPRLEKLTILLLQLKLCIQLGDMYQVPIISRTFSARALSKPDTMELKRQYFMLMQEYYEHERLPLLVGRTWLEISTTYGPEDANLVHSLVNAAIMCILAPHTAQKDIADAAEFCAFSPETERRSRTEWLSDLQNDKRIEISNPPLYSLIVAFNSTDLVRVSAQDDIDIVHLHPLISSHPQRKQDLRRRVSEHDVIVMATYFTRIRIPRLASLAGLTVEECEEYLLSLVSSKEVYAKIDRVDGVVVFRRPDDATVVKSRWNQSVEEMVALLDRAAHLTMKERALEAVRAATSAA